MPRLSLVIAAIVGAVCLASEAGAGITVSVSATSGGVCLAMLARS